MEHQAIAETQKTTTRIRRSDLLESIKQNRDTHESEWGEAMKGWRKEYVKALKKHQKEVTTLLSGLTDGGETPDNAEYLHFRAPRQPANHLKDYDRIIRRLEMTIDEEIFLSHKDFDQYVLDDWSWKGEFAATNALYSEKI
jgi:hypothetical protein